MCGGIVYIWIKPSSVFTNFLVYRFHKSDSFVSEFVLDTEVKQHKKKSPAPHQRMFPLSAKKGTNMEKYELSFLNR